MLKYALLGLLRERPDHGYQLKKRFDERMGPLWRLNAGQVYQTLGALTRAGLVAEIAVEDGRGDHDLARPRRVFALQPKGDRALEHWLQRLPARAKLTRDGTLLRLLVLVPEQYSAAAEQIEKLAHIYRQRLTRLLAEKRKVPARAEGAALVRKLGLEAALLQTEAHIKWLEFVQGCLRGTTGVVQHQMER